MTPLGANRPVPVDVRIVAATNRDLAAGADEGSFRRDLYARLALYEIDVPPVRERRPDLLAWVHRLHRRWLDQRGSPPRALLFEPVVAEALLLHPWPENLRGIDRLVHELAGETGPVGLQRLPPWLASAPAAAPASALEPAGRLAAPTRDELQAVLRDTGSIAAAAKHFGRDRRQIYRWIEAYGLDRPSKP